MSACWMFTATWWKKPLGRFRRRRGGRHQAASVVRQKKPDTVQSEKTARTLTNQRIGAGGQLSIRTPAYLAWRPLQATTGASAHLWVR